MILLLQYEENYLWLAPYGYSIVLIGILFFLFRVFETWYASAFDKPLFRHYYVYKKLSDSQIEILNEEFEFYKLLSEKHKRQFRHRLSLFLSDKKFIGRENINVTERMEVLIASIGCMLSFGRKNFNYGLIEHILIYPGQFYSATNDAYHIGEFNPRGRALVISWKDFEYGFRITDDNKNLGIHEFMHAMQLEAKQSRDTDSSRLLKQFQNILKQLTNQEVKDKLDETRFFRAYAFTNQYEFLAVLAEYFIESPHEFKEHFPQLYAHTHKMLNFNFAHY